MSDLVEDLDGLIEQATKERSHYYVATVAARAKEEIVTLRKFRDLIQEATAEAYGEAILATLKEAAAKADGILQDE